MKWLPERVFCEGWLFGFTTGMLVVALVSLLKIAIDLWSVMQWL